MRKNKIRKFAAVVLTAAMVASMGGMTALAENIDNAKVEISKTVTKNAQDYLPATDFTFSIDYVSELTGTKDADGNAVAAPERLATIPSGSKITSSPSNASLESTSVLLEDKITIAIDTTYKIPGIYRYKVTENAGSYEAITYSKEEKYFDVYVGENGPFAYTFVNEAGDAKADANFTNDYTGTTDGDPIGNLTLTKKVDGNQAETNKNFSFAIKINGADGEKYYVTFSDNRTPVTIDSNAPAATTITLSAEQTATIHGLSKSDAYEIVETNYSADGYKEIKIEGADYGNHKGYANVTDENLKVTGTGADEITYTNKKNVTTPTGIALSFAPYALLVVLAGVFGTLFLRKRREDEI